MPRPRTLFLTAAAISALVTTVIAQPPPRPLPPTVTQAGFSQPSASAQTRPGRDLSRLPPLTQQFMLSAQRGSEWLYRMHQPTGRFVPGWHPALNHAEESDNFLHQAAAAATLAQAGRFFRSDAYAARSSQALLTLLAETGPDPRDPTSRTTTLPSSMINKLSSAGLLLAAIAETPSPPPDLLEQGEQLARFIVRQQRPDGALVASDLSADTADFESLQLAPGLALTGLMRSHAQRPGPWKLDAARRALAYYRPWWREHRHLVFASAMTPAFAEAFLQTKDRARDIGFAEFACEMADWLCTQQFDKLDPRRPLWCGGFPESAGSPPTIAAAGCAAALVDAARVTRQLPDAERFARYRDAATLALQFAAVLQFTEANTQQFTSSYREQFLLGAFRTAPSDATLRLDGTQQAVAAMINYLMRILEVA